MARSITTSKLLLTHMEWAGDSLLVHLYKVKNDQEGESECTMNPKHVFANPLDPLLCPIVALAIKVVCTTPNNNMALFDTKAHGEKFCKWLVDVLSKFSEEDQVRILKAWAHDFGVHSLRKGKHLISYYVSRINRQDVYPYRTLSTYRYTLTK